MRRFLSLLCFLLLSLAFVHPTGAQKVDVYERPLRFERIHDYDVLHYRIQLEFDEERKTFQGENTITLIPSRDGFTTCILDAESFSVIGVHGESAAPLKFEQPPHELIVHLERPYRSGEALSFTVSYIAENVIVASEKFGMSPGYALGLSFLDECAEHPRLIQALSFPTGARHWFPCYDHPSDKATQEMIVTVRDSYKALSNGRLVGITENEHEKTRTFHWSLEKPHPTYLSMLVAGPYEVIEDSLGDLPIHYWVYRKDKENALLSFRKTPEIISFFNREFGTPYPWSKCDQITIPGIGGGAECTSATLIGQGVIHDGRADQDFPTHWLVAHEAAHQWWGDLITLRDWGHTWVNESFGTYFEYLFMRYDLGDDEGAVNLQDKKNTYLSEARNRYIRPIVFHRWNTPNENFDRHTYQKGASVIHMLRWILGDEPFRKTLSRFLHKHAFQPAGTHDFLAAVREVTGRNMDWFFEQWLYRPGHPVFDIGYAWKEDAGMLALTIRQTQDTSAMVPVFKTPVVIGIVTSRGKQTERIHLSKVEEVFEFACNEKPLMVRFDEGNYLLKEWRFVKGIDELLYQLEHDDAIGRMWAASELGRFGDDRLAVGGLIKSAEEDPFWAVRRDAVHALGALGKSEHIEHLKRKAVESSSKVRAAALSRLGDFGRQDLVPFLEARFLKEDSYLAQAEAVRAIGKCGTPASTPLLREALNMKSPRNVIQRAAEWAIEKIGKSASDR